MSATSRDVLAAVPHRPSSAHRGKDPSAYTGAGRGAAGEFVAETDTLDGGDGYDTAILNGSDTHSNCETIL